MPTIPVGPAAGTTQYGFVRIATAPASAADPVVVGDNDPRLSGGAPSGPAGGSLAGTYPNPTLSAVGTAGTYGSATKVAVLTTTSEGRVSAVTETTIAGVAPGGSAGGDLTGSYPSPTLAAAGTAGTYGDATHVPVFTTDSKGRVTAVTNTAITTTPPVTVVNGGRLTLTTGVPVTTADVTGATTIYWTPYTSGAITLWDDSASALTTVVATEKSIAVPTLASVLSAVTALANVTSPPPTVTVSGTPTSLQQYVIVVTTGATLVSGNVRFKWSSNSGASWTTGAQPNSGTGAVTIDGAALVFASGTYATDNVYTFIAGKAVDVFGYLSGGTLALETLAWTNSTTRATALAYANGMLCKSGDATRRYLGSIYPTGNTTTTTTEDSVKRRLVWNMDNRLPRRLAVTDTTASWTWAASAGTGWRWANGAMAGYTVTALPQVEVMRGLDETPVSLSAALILSAATSDQSTFCAVALDGWTPTMADQAGVIAWCKASYYVTPATRYEALPGVGFHRLCWLEGRNLTTGIITYLGAITPGGLSGGMVGNTVQ